MKYTNFLLILTIVSFSLHCKKEEAPPIGAPYSQVKGIQDEWELNKVEMSDDITDPDVLIDVSDLMLGDTASILSFSEKNYILQAGSSIHFIPAQGEWFFDNNEFPSQIHLASGGNEIIVDHLHPVREVVDNTLKYRYHRIADACAGTYAGQSVVSYVYTYTRK